MDTVTITLPLRDLQFLFIRAELWAFRKLRTNPEMTTELRRIAESAEKQAGKKLTVASHLAHKET